MIANDSIKLAKIDKQMFSYPIIQIFKNAENIAGVTD